MATTIPIRVQHKRMTKSQWLASSVIPLAGELVVESDTGFTKIGDGVKRYADLKYAQSPLVNKYVTTIGNATGTEYTVTHNLGTSDVVVQTWQGNEMVLVDTVVVSTTQVKLVFASAPGNNSIKVVVLG